MNLLSDNVSSEAQNRISTWTIDDFDLNGWNFIQVSPYSFRLIQNCVISGCRWRIAHRWPKLRRITVFSVDAYASSYKWIFIHMNSHLIDSHNSSKWHQQFNGMNIYCRSGIAKYKTIFSCILWIYGLRTDWKKRNENKQQRMKRAKRTKNSKTQ